LKSKSESFKDIFFQISLFFFNLIISWVLFDSIKLIKDNYQVLVVNIITLIVCVFLIIYLSNHLDNKTTIIIGTFVLTLGLVSTFTISNLFCTILIIFGYTFLISPLWTESQKNHRMSNFILINLLFSFIFGYFMEILGDINKISLLTMNTVWTSIFLLIIGIILVNWLIPTSEKRDMNNKKLKINNNYRISYNIIQSISIGLLLFLIMTLMNFEVFPLNCFTVNYSFFVMINVITMGIIVIISMIFTNIEIVNSLKFLKIIYYSTLVFKCVIAILLAISLIFSFLSIILLIIGGILSFICIFLDQIILNKYNIVWWMPLSLIITLGIYIFIIVIPNQLILFLIVALILFGVSFISRNFILRTVPALKELEKEDD